MTDEKMNDKTGLMELLTNKDVGYGKPPKHTQFKKGKSGNPKGRPPKKYLAQVLEDILNEQVTLTINGEKKKMSKKDVTVQQLISECMKGKQTAIRNLIYLMRSLYSMMPM